MGTQGVLLDNLKAPYTPTDFTPSTPNALQVRDNDGVSGTATGLWQCLNGIWTRVGPPSTHAAQHEPGGTDVIPNIPVFAANTAYLANYVIQVSGVLYYRTTSGTSGASWSADSSNWTAVPATLTGTAGGDLTGTYPNPTIAKLQGTTLASPPGGSTEYLRGDGTWAVPTGTGSGVSSVAAGDLSIVIGGTGGSPTVETGTLDEIAALHPPAAAVAMNAQKITGLANGSASSDAMAFGQIPTTATTQTQGDATTSIATDAFVNNALVSAGVGYNGMLAPTTGFTGTSTYQMTAGRVTYGRFVPLRNLSITLVALCITSAATSNDPLEVAIMSSSGSRLVTTGATTGVANVLGIGTISLSYSLVAGTVYYVAVLCATVGGTAASFHSCSNSNATAMQLFGASIGTMAMFYQNGQTSVVPTSASSTGPNNAMPYVALRVS